MEYIAITHLDADSEWYPQLCLLHEAIFGASPYDTIHEELSERRDYLVLIALEAAEAVGYKIGYRERKTRFYSWLGGVHPASRGRGIASELMRIQHDWCKSHGCAVVRTHTKNTWRDMLILNLRHGFDIIGTYTDRTGEPRIILEKKL